MSFLPEHGVYCPVEVPAMLQRQVTVCHGPCFPPGWVNLDCSPPVRPQPSTHWSHRLFTGISLHSSHYLGLACQGRFSPMEQSSHSLAKFPAGQMRLKRNEKQRNCFGHALEKPKYLGFLAGWVFLVFFFLDWRKEPWIAAYQWGLQSMAKNLISAQSGHPEHGVSLDYLTLPAQTTASLPEAMGESTGRSFSFPQHPLSHFHAVWSSVVVRVIHAFQIW